MIAVALKMVVPNLGGKLFPPQRCLYWVFIEQSCKKFKLSV